MNDTKGNFNESTRTYVYQGVGALNPKDTILFLNFGCLKAIFVPGLAIYK
jgi:hypothetical protein